MKNTRRICHKDSRSLYLQVETMQDLLRTGLRKVTVSPHFLQQSSKQPLLRQ